VDVAFVLESEILVQLIELNAHLNVNLGKRGEATCVH
jgi:hypothetical protein